MILKIQKMIPKLLYFAIFTTIIVSTFSLSKYESTIIGSSSVSVASFVVDASSNDSDNLSIDCNSSDPMTNYNIVVSNNKDGIISQVSIMYDVVLEFSEVPPTGLTLSIGSQTLTTIDRQTTYTFKNVGSFSPSIEGNNNHSIIIKGNNQILTEYAGNVSFYVDAYQVD